MNKKIMMAIGAMVVAAVLGLIFSQNLSVSAGPDLSEDDVTAKVKAQYPGEITELELDEKGKDPVYEVEIVIDGKEYELKIDGNSGEVLKLDEKLTATAAEKKANTEKEQKTDAAQSAKKENESLQMKEKVTDNAADKTEKQTSERKTDEDKQSTKSNENKTVKAPKNKEDSEKQQANKDAAKEKTEKKQSIISNQEAIDIALKQFSGNIESIELDEDDGRLIYEIEIESSRGEAEIEIDAYTGKVLVVDIDLEDD